MALIINEGLSGHGNRVRLPNYVLAGVRELFPDPAAVYTGHKEKD
jgi:predicted metal-dependent RNase